VGKNKAGKKETDKVVLGREFQSGDCDDCAFRKNRVKLCELISFELIHSLFIG